MGSAREEEERRRLNEAEENRPDDGVWGHGWAVAGLVSDQSRGEEQLCSSICPFYVPPSTGWEETIVRIVERIRLEKLEEGWLFLPLLRSIFITCPFSLGQEKYFSIPFERITMKLIFHL